MDIGPGAAPSSCASSGVCENALGLLAHPFLYVFGPYVFVRTKVTLLFCPGIHTQVTFLFCPGFHTQMFSHVYPKNSGELRGGEHLKEEKESPTII